MQEELRVDSRVVDSVVAVAAAEAVGRFVVWVTSLERAVFPWVSLPQRAHRVLLPPEEFLVVFLRVVLFLEALRVVFRQAATPQEGFRPEELPSAELLREFLLGAVFLSRLRQASKTEHLAAMLPPRQGVRRSPEDLLLLCRQHTTQDLV